MSTTTTTTTTINASPSHQPANEATATPIPSSDEPTTDDDLVDSYLSTLDSLLATFESVAAARRARTREEEKQKKREQAMLEEEEQEAADRAERAALADAERARDDAARKEAEEREAALECAREEARVREAAREDARRAVAEAVVEGYLAVLEMWREWLDRGGDGAVEMVEEMVDAWWREMRGESGDDDDSGGGEGFCHDCSSAALRERLRAMREARMAGGPVARREGEKEELRAAGRRDERRARREEKRPRGKRCGQRGRNKRPSGWSGSTPR